MTEKSTESELFSRSDAPHTRECIAADLVRLGLRSGDTVIVYSLLSSIGWVSGGPVEVVHALMDVATEGALS